MKITAKVLQVFEFTITQDNVETKSEYAFSTDKKLEAFMNEAMSNGRAIYATLKYTVAIDPVIKDERKHIATTVD